MRTTTQMRAALKGMLADKVEKLSLQAVVFSSGGGGNPCHDPENGRFCAEGTPGHAEHGGAPYSGPLGVTVTPTPHAIDQIKSAGLEKAVSISDLVSWIKNKKPDGIRVAQSGGTNTLGRPVQPTYFYDLPGDYYPEEAAGTGKSKLRAGVVFDPVNNQIITVYPSSREIVENKLPWRAQRTQELLAGKTNPSSYEKKQAKDQAKHDYDAKVREDTKARIEKFNTSHATAPVPKVPAPAVVHEPAPIKLSKNEQAKYDSSSEDGKKAYVEMLKRKGRK